MLRLANSLAGPFTLSVWTYPALLRAGTIHFSVLALEATTGQPVVNPTVLIEAVAGDTHTHSAPITAYTYLDPISRYQEANLALLTPGQYEITVQVTGKDGQQGQTIFALEIVSATGFKWLIILLMGQAGLFALWLAKEGIRTWGIDRYLKRSRPLRSEN